MFLSSYNTPTKAFCSEIGRPVRAVSKQSGMSTRFASFDSLSTLKAIISALIATLVLSSGFFITEELHCCLASTFNQIYFSQFPLHNDC